MQGCVKIPQKILRKVLSVRKKVLTLHSLSGMNEISRGETEVIEILATKTKVVQRNSERQGKNVKRTVSVDDTLELKRYETGKDTTANNKGHPSGRRIVGSARRRTTGPTAPRS